MINISFVLLAVIISVAIAVTWYATVGRHNLRGRLAGESKKPLAHTIATFVVILYAILPFMTYTVLIVNYNTYPANELAKGGGTIWTAVEVLSGGFHLPFILLNWWPFVVIYIIILRFTRDINIKIGRVFGAMIIPGLIIFLIPFLLMIFVLPFDVMEMDFPRYSIVVLTYAVYFFLIAPAIGIILALVWLLGARFVMRRYSVSA